MFNLVQFLQKRAASSGIQPLKEKIAPQEIKGIAPVEQLGKVPEIKKIDEPVESLTSAITDKPLKKIAYARNTGLADCDGFPYTNTYDVLLLNKLGYSIDENSYLFLPRGQEKEGLYSYIEKNAGVPKIVTRAIDEGKAFSSEYLKSMDYNVPKGYEIKGDLCCPVEKTRKEEKESPEKTAVLGAKNSIKLIPKNERTSLIRSYRKLLEKQDPANKKAIRAAMGASQKGLKQPKIVNINDKPHILHYRGVADNNISLLQKNKNYQKNKPLKDIDYEQHVVDSLSDGKNLLMSTSTDPMVAKGWSTRHGQRPSGYVGTYATPLEDLARLQKTKQQGAMVNKTPTEQEITIADGGNLLKAAPVMTGFTPRRGPGYRLRNTEKSIVYPKKIGVNFLDKLKNALGLGKTAAADPSALVVSGIHGDEPAGNMAAKKLEDHVDVVSEINPSNKRRFRGKDINRHFDKPSAGKKQKNLLDIIKEKKPSRVISLHEDNEADKPYAYSSESLKEETKEALKDKDTAASAHGDETDNGVISKGKNPPDGSLEKALDNRGIDRVTVETPSKSQDIDQRVKTQLDVVKGLLDKTSAATHELKSSNIKAVGYNKEDKSLDVAFHSGGSYTYKDVPKSLFDRIKRVKSPGKFFHKHIKRDNSYKYEKMEKDSEYKWYKSKDLSQRLVAGRPYPFSYLTGEAKELLDAVKNRDWENFKEEVGDTSFGAQMLLSQATGLNHPVYADLSKAWAREKVWKDMFKEKGKEYHPNHMQGGSNYAKASKIIKAFASAGIKVDQREAERLANKYTGGKMEKEASKQPLLPGIRKWIKTQPFNHAEDAYKHGRIPKHVRDDVVSGRAAEKYRPKFKEMLDNIRNSGT
jgi:NTP pyrophosphatase (non-canonical NTP hydrolase)